MPNDLTIKFNSKYKGDKDFNDAFHRFNTKTGKSMSNAKNLKMPHKSFETINNETKRDMDRIESRENTKIQVAVDDSATTTGDTTYGSSRVNTSTKWVTKSTATPGKLYHLQHMNTLSKNHTEQMNQLGAINSTLSKMAEFQISIQSNYYKTSLENQNVMISELKEIKNALMLGFNINPRTGKKEEEKKEKELTILDKLLFRGGKSEFKSAFKDVRDKAIYRVADKIKDAIPFYSEMELALDTISENPGLAVTGAIKSGARWKVNEFVDNTLLKKMPGLGKLIKNPDAATRNAIFKNKKNGIGSILSDLLGVSLDRQGAQAALTHDQRKLESVKREHAAFDGKAHQALTELIPNLLSRQLAVMSGETVQYWDYDRQRFTTGKDIQNRMNKSAYSEPYRAAVDNSKVHFIDPNINNKVFTKRDKNGNYYKTTKQGKENTYVGFLNTTALEWLKQIHTNDANMLRDTITKWNNSGSLLLHDLDTLIYHTFRKIRESDDDDPENAFASESKQSIIETIGTLDYYIIKDYILEVVKELAAHGNNTFSDTNLLLTAIDFIHRLFKVLGTHNNDELVAFYRRTISQNFSKSVMEHQKEFTKDITPIVNTTFLSGTNDIINRTGLGFGNGTGTGKIVTNNSGGASNTNTKIPINLRDASEKKITSYIIASTRQSPSILYYNSNGKLVKCIFTVEGDKIYFVEIVDEGKGKIGPAKNFKPIKIEAGNIIFGEKGIKLKNAVNLFDISNNEIFDAAAEFIIKYSDINNIKDANMSEEDRRAINNLQKNFKRTVDNYKNADFSNEAEYSSGYTHNTSFSNNVYSSEFEIASRSEKSRRIQAFMKREFGPSFMALVAISRRLRKEVPEGEKDYVAGIMKKLKVEPAYTKLLKVLGQSEVDTLLKKFIEEDGDFSEDRLIGHYDSNDKFKKSVDDYYASTDSGLNTSNAYAHNLLIDMISDKGVMQGISDFTNMAYRGKANAKLVTIASNLLSSAGGGILGGESIPVAITKALIRGKLTGAGAKLVTELNEAYDKSKLIGLTDAEIEYKQYKAQEKLATEMAAGNLASYLGSGAGKKIQKWMSHNIRFGGVMGLIANLAVSTVGPTLLKPLISGGKNLLKGISKRVLGDFNPLTREDELAKAAEESRRDGESKVLNPEDVESNDLLKDLNNDTSGSASPNGRGRATSTPGIIDGKSYISKVSNSTCAADALVALLHHVSSETGISSFSDYTDMTNHPSYQTALAKSADYANKDGIKYTYFYDVLSSMLLDNNGVKGRLSTITRNAKGLPLVKSVMYALRQGKIGGAILLIKTDKKLAKNKYQNHYVTLIYKRGTYYVYDGYTPEKGFYKVDPTVFMFSALRAVVLSDVKMEAEVEFKEYNSHSASTSDIPSSGTSEDDSEEYSMRYSSKYSRGFFYKKDKNTGKDIPAAFDMIKINISDPASIQESLRALERSDNPEDRKKAKALRKFLNKTTFDNAKGESTSKIKGSIFNSTKHDDSVYDNFKGGPGLFGLAKKILGTLLVDTGLKTAVGSLLGGLATAGGFGLSALTSLIGAGITASVAYGGFKLLSGLVSNTLSFFADKGLGLGASALNMFGADIDKKELSNNVWTHGKAGAKRYLTGLTMASAGRSLARGAFSSTAQLIKGNVAKTGIKEVIQAGGKAGIKAVGQPAGIVGKIMRPVLRLFGKLTGQLAGFLTYIFGAPGMKIAKALNSTKVGSAITNAIKKAMTEAMEAASKAVAKAGQSTIGGAIRRVGGALGFATAGLTDIAFSIGFAMYGVYRGNRDAHKMLGLNSPDDVTTSQRIACILTAGLVDAIPSLPIISQLNATGLSVMIAIFTNTLEPYLLQAILSVLGVFGFDTEIPGESENFTLPTASTSNASNNKSYEVRRYTSKDTAESLSIRPALAGNGFNYSSSYQLGGTGSISSYGGVAGSSVYISLRSGLKVSTDGGLPVFISQKDFNVDLGGVNAKFNGCALACAKMVSEFYSKDIDDSSLVNTAEKYLTDSKAVSTDFFAAINGSKVNPVEWVNEVKKTNVGMWTILISVGLNNHFINVFTRDGRIYIGDPMQDGWEQVTYSFVNQLQVKHIRRFDNTKGINPNPDKSLLGGTGILSKAISSVKNYFKGNKNDVDDIDPETDANRAGLKSGANKSTPSYGSTAASSSINAIAALKYGASGLIQNGVRIPDGIGMPTGAGITVDSTKYQNAPASWIQVAIAEAAKGIEVPKASNPSAWKKGDPSVDRVLTYIKVATSLNKDATDITKVPVVNWCGAFVTYCLLTAGVDLKGYSAALSSQGPTTSNLFIKLNNPVVGALAVFKYNANGPSTGHITMVKSVNPDGGVTYIGGNQTKSSNTRGITTITTKKGQYTYMSNAHLVGFYWPKNAPMNQTTNTDAATDASGFKLGSLSYDFSKVTFGNKLDDKPDIKVRLSAAFTAAAKAEKDGLKRPDPLLITAMSIMEHGWDNKGSISLGNNPGNIGSWNKAPKDGTPVYKAKNGKYFVKYNSLVDGFYAMIKNYNSGKHDGYNKFINGGSIMDLLNTWAPPHENDTSGYAKFISNAVKDKNSLGGITQSMIDQAGGKKTSKPANFTASATNNSNMYIKLIKAHLSDLSRLNITKDIVCGPFVIGGLAIRHGLANSNDLIRAWNKNSSILSEGGLSNTVLTDYFGFYPDQSMGGANIQAINASISRSGRLPASLKSAMIKDDPNRLLIASCKRNGKPHWIAFTALDDNVYVLDSMTDGGVSTNIHRSVRIIDFYVSNTDVFGSLIASFISDSPTRVLTYSDDEDIANSGTKALSTGNRMISSLGRVTGLDSVGSFFTGKPANEDARKYAATHEKYDVSKEISGAVESVGAIVKDFWKESTKNTMESINVLKDIFDVNKSIDNKTGTNNDRLAQLISDLKGTSDTLGPNAPEATGELSDLYPDLKKIASRWSRDPLKM